MTCPCGKKNNSFLGTTGAWLHSATAGARHVDDAAKDFLGGTLRSGKGVEHRVVRDDVETHVRIDLLNELVHALAGELNFIAIIFGDLDGVVVDFHLAI